MATETSNDVALVNAASLLLHLSGMRDEALRLLNRMSASSRAVVASNASSMRASNLRGWLELAEGGAGSAAAERHFWASIGESENNTDAMLGTRYRSPTNTTKGSRPYNG